MKNSFLVDKIIFVLVILLAIIFFILHESCSTLKKSSLKKDTESSVSKTGLNISDTSVGSSINKSDNSSKESYDWWKVNGFI